PTFYHEAVSSFTATGGTSQGVFGASLLNSAVYDPMSSGAIASISFSFDRILISQEGGTPDPFHALLIFQNGSYYASTNSPTTSFTWTSLSGSSLSAIDFSKLVGPGPSIPDFSATASELTFGYKTSVAAANPGTITITSGVDNYSVTISNVPEP